MPHFLLGWASITARAAYKARSRVSAALNEYYAERHDTDEQAAQLVKECAQVIRQYGVAQEDEGLFGLPLLHVATSNTIPVAYWFFSEVFSRPDLVRQLRTESEGAVIWSGEQSTTATVSLDTLADKCPLLFSCYSETIRTKNRAPISRRVTADTVITDGKGLAYNLKGETDLQCSMGALHLNKDVWGADAHSFEPTRFLKTNNKSSSTASARRAAFAPFGGGQHLCPGRMFAQAENLGFILALVLGYEISPLHVDGGWDSVVLPDKQPLAVGQGLLKPVNNGRGFGVKIAMRPGWESVEWNFVSGSS